MAYTKRNANGQATMANSQPAVFASDQTALPTLDTNSAAIKTALEIIDNFISGSRGLVTEDNSAAVKAAVEAISTVQGAIADAIVAAGATGSVSAKLRRATQGLEDLKTGIILAAGTNAIGKLAANSGVDIGDATINNGITEPVPVQIRPRNQTFRLFVPKQAVGANLVYFDLFNASGSGVVLRILQVTPIVSGAVAVVGTLGVDLFLTKTTSVGTGGTAATVNATSLTAASITEMDSGNTDPHANITARLTPTGGAAAGAVISWASVFTEETNASTYYGQTIDMATRNSPDIQPVVLNANQGIRVVQGSVASVGNIGFDVIFEIQ